MALIMACFEGNLQGIWRVPFSHVLGLNKLDLEAKVFYMAEDIIQQIMLSILTVMHEMMRIMNIKTPIELMYWVKLNSHMYELLYACIYYFTPYFMMRSAIKWAKNEIVMEFWHYWLHLFIRTNKYKYAILFLHFMHTMKAFNPEIAQFLAQNRVFSFSGVEGSGMPIDVFNELV